MVGKVYVSESLVIDKKLWRIEKNFKYGEFKYVYLMNNIYIKCYFYLFL